MLRITLPLKIATSKKKYFILNLNNYRNAHYRILSTAKRNFFQYIFDLRIPKQTFKRLICHYHIYPQSKRRFDTLNVISIVDKFLMDALVTLGFIEDDDHTRVLMPLCTVHPVDRENPRCEVEINEI